MNPSQLLTKTRHARRTNVIRLIVARLPIRSHSVQAFVGAGTTTGSQSRRGLCSESSECHPLHCRKTSQASGTGTTSSRQICKKVGGSCLHCPQTLTNTALKEQPNIWCVSGCSATLFKASEFGKKGMLENPCETARAFVPGAQKQRSDCVHGCQNLDKRIWQANISKCTSCFSCGRCGEDNGHVFCF